MTAEAGTMTAAAEAMAVMAGGTAAAVRTGRETAAVRPVAAPPMEMPPAGTVRIEEALAMADVPARI